MPKQTIAFCFLSLCLFLTACATMSDKEKQLAICRELKSQLVFKSPSTDPNTLRQADKDLQYSDQALAQRNYNAYGCDQLENH